jgi:ATP-binding cassette subfamily B protein
LALGILFISISNFFAIFPARLIRDSLDTVQQALNSERNSQFTDDVISKLIFLGLVILAAALLKGLFMFFMRQTIIVMSRLIEYDLKNEMFEHYQKLSLSFYKKNNTGDLMARISEDVSRVRMYVGPSIMYSIQIATLLLFTTTAMFLVNGTLALYVLIPLPILSILIYIVSDKINKKSDSVQSQLSKLSTFVQETFSGIRLIKSFGKEDIFYNQFEKESIEYQNLSLSLNKTEAFFSPVIGVLIGMSMLLSIYVGGIKVINNEISIGNIAEFVYYVNLLSWPVASVGWVSSLIQRAAASQERINTFLRTEPEIKNPSSEKIEISGSIEFKNVQFVYPESKIRALKNISFNIGAGESIGIIGKTGSGKSTIANLITRLYDVSEGDILIDNKNVKEFNLELLRKNIAYVPQDIFLFSDTISNNISFGIHDQSKSNIEAQIIQAAKTSQIYDNIMEFPSQFDTYIGERGVTLSGGQKQRISIARAIIGSPKILVFDDCLSAVDLETEDAILNNLKILMKGKTTIIISHRISTVKHADKIIVLNEGMIAEEGRHDELIGKGGIYFQFYKKQLLENDYKYF